MAEEAAPKLKRGISSAGLQGKDAVREGGRHAQENAGRPSRTARHHNQPIATRLFALGILLIALALVILTIATRLISALLILPIALRITLLMLLTIVLMLIVFALTRILLVLLAGVVRTLFVTHHFTPYRLIIRGSGSAAGGQSKGDMPYTKRLSPKTGSRQILQAMAKANRARCSIICLSTLK